jgi:VanZ family protein
MPTEAATAARLARFARFAFVALLFGIFVLGSHPAAGHLFLPPWDKLAHIVLFAVIAATIATAWPRLHWAGVLALGLLIGFADELHQVFLPERHPGWDDGLADLAGLALGLLLIARHRRTRQ